MKFQLVILLAVAVTSYAHVATLGVAPAALGALGLVHLGLKGAALAGVGAGLHTAAKLGVVGAGLSIGSRFRRQNKLFGEPEITVSGGIDDIKEEGSDAGNSGGNDGQWNGEGLGSWSNGYLANWNNGNDGSWNNGNNGGNWNNGNNGGNWNNGNNGGNWNGNDGRGNGDWNNNNKNNNNHGHHHAAVHSDWNNDHHHWTLVGPPKGASHITLLQGNSAHDAYVGGNDANRRSGWGSDADHGHKSGVYVAVNRGAIHEAPLVGHIASVKSTNLDSAPGTTW